MHPSITPLLWESGFSAGCLFLTCPSPEGKGPENLPIFLGVQPLFVFFEKKFRPENTRKKGI